MLKEFFKPYEIVDEVNIQALEEGTSRRTALVTLAKPRDVEEAQDIISRFSGIVLNGNKVSIRLFGRPLISSTALAEADSALPECDNVLNSQVNPNRRVIRARTKTAALAPTLTSHIGAEGPDRGNSQVTMKEEDQNLNLIVVPQYDDIDTKPEIKEKDTDETNGIAGGELTAPLEDDTNHNPAPPDFAFDEAIRQPDDDGLPLSEPNPQGADITIEANTRSTLGHHESPEVPSTSASETPTILPRDLRRVLRVPVSEESLELAHKYVDRYAGPSTDVLERAFFERSCA